MKYKSNSLKLSIAFTSFFAILLLILTLAGPWVVEFLCKHFHHEHLTNYLIVITYCAIPAGWSAIYFLFKILSDVNKGEVFTDSIVKSLNILSWLCLYVGVLSGFATIKFAMFILVSPSALFIGLIVRIVRNIINEAIEIKAENDMTV